MPYQQETIEQTKVVRFIEKYGIRDENNQLNILYCATAGGVKLSMIQAKVLKMIGYNKGVPDLQFFNPIYDYIDEDIIANGLHIEMKKLKGNNGTKEQREWKEKLNRNGYISHICKGSLSAIKCIRDYYYQHDKPYLKDNEQTYFKPEVYTFTDEDLIYRMDLLTQNLKRK